MKKLRNTVLKLMLPLLFLSSFGVQEAQSQCFITGAYVQFRCIGYQMFLDSVWVQTNNPPAGGWLTVTYGATGAVDSFPAPHGSPRSVWPNTQFSNINNPTILSGPGSGSTITICYTADPNCCITIPYNDLFACYCNISAGTVGVTMNPANQSNNNYVLCIDDEVTITSNNDFSFDVQPPFPAPGFVYGIYKCPPTPGISPVLDTCLVGLAPVNATGINIQNLYGQFPPGLLSAFTGWQNNTLYFAPIILRNSASNPVTIDTDCWSVGPSTAVTFLDSITYTTQQNCLLSGIDVVINGGSPALFGGNYTISGLTPGYATLSTTTPAPGQTVSVGNLNNNDSFTFTITDPNGCSRTITGGPYIAPVTAGFTATSVCQGTATQFTDQSTGVVTGWNWNFTGGTSTQQNPSFTYPAAGTYNVKQVVQNAQGCKDSVTNQITVYPSPSVDFTFDSVCVGDQTCFTDLSTVPGATITGWQWVFGDGSPVNNQQNPCHTYAAPGNYNVNLIATTSDGCTGSAVKQVTVFAVPTAAFAVNNVCEGLAAQFNDQSTPLGSITGWNWNFGNGGTSTQQNPAYSYANPGTYNVKLVVGSGTGCLDSITQQITVHEKPTAAFNQTDVCVGTAMNFTDGSTVGTGTITGWGWNFGDGNTSTQQNPSHNYAFSGQYTVTLIVTTNNGCADTISQTVNVHPSPVAAFTATTACEGGMTQFTDQTTGNPGAWAWDFGDGGTSAGQNPQHQYGAPGTYNVKLVVTSTNGCVDSVTQPVTVHPVPQVEFTPDITDGCNPVCVNFTHSVTISGGSVTGYAWSFGDGNTSTDPNPSHCFYNTTQSLATFNVKLVATSDQGCKDSLTKQALISVFPIPVAGFTWQPQIVKILNPTVDFGDLSVGANQWSWDFGDGNTSATQNPTHTYKDTGTFVIWQYVENQYGCRDSTWSTLRVLPEVFYYIPNAFTLTGDGTNDKWFPKGIGVAEEHIMVFDRWGELIFESHDVGGKWDGTYKGTKVKTDVYVYRIEMKDVLGDEHTYIGRVTLLK